MKKILSFVLTVSITLSMLLSLGIASGVLLTSAANETNEANELWLIEGSSNALIRGVREPIENGSEPYLYMGESQTAYVPLGPVCAFTGVSYTKSGDAVTLTYGGSAAALTVGSIEWTLSGEAQRSLALPVRVDDGGSVMISAMTARTVMSALTGLTLRSWLNESIGLIVFSNGTISYLPDQSGETEYSLLKAQIKVTYKLLFDTPTGDDIYNDVEEYVGLDTHPRIIINQDKFDALRAAYTAGDADSYTYIWLGATIRQAQNYVLQMFDVGQDGSVAWKCGEPPIDMRHPYYIYDENGNRLVGAREYTYPDGTTVRCDGSGNGDGYDEGGRLNEGVNIGNIFMPLALAYQLTGQVEYANAVYAVIKQLGTWAHWGDCHSLNVADTAVNVAIAIDWTWHAFDGARAGMREEMCDILYRLGLVKGYWLSRGHSSSGAQQALYHRVGGCAAYGTGSSNNWQTVCGSGMIISALTLMGNPKYDEYAKHVAATYLKATNNCLMQYAPDGGYMESPGYWGYGSGTFIYTLAALATAVGTDYGYLDTVGLRESFYFANYICDTGYNAWNYHDGTSNVIKGTGAEANSTFMYMAAVLFDDANIAYFRDNMIFRAGAKTGLFDAVFYDPTLSDEHDEDLSLDYFNKGIETVTMRGDWEPGSNFAGLHVGANIVSHGDMDSGNFYLDMGGVLWVGDLGSENYNIGSYFSDTHRYKYYAKSIESHSTVAIIDWDDMPYGQVRTSQSTDYAKIDEFVSLDDGALAIADMTPNYGVACVGAKRGLLFTNSRNTVIIQDEIKFDTETDLAWICALNKINDISDDGRTVYCQTFSASENKVVRLRATLVSDDPDLKFTLSGKRHLLKNTISDLNATEHSFVDFPERARTVANRLLIEANGVTNFNVAVVFELIDHESEVVGYEWKDMSTWATSGIVSDEWVKDANRWIDYGDDESTGPSYKYTVADLIMAMAKIDAAATELARMKAIYDAFIRTTDIDLELSAVQMKIAELEPYLAEYNEYVRAFNTAFKNYVVDYIAPVVED